MKFIGIIAVLISAGCLAAIMLRNLTLVWDFWFVPDYAKELSPVDKRLALTCGIFFFVGLACLLVSS
jgi:hypothetical protein